MIGSGWIFPLSFAVICVVCFRLWIRKPRGVSIQDPEALRTLVIFEGDTPDLFAKDEPDGMFIGIALFDSICDTLGSTHDWKVLERGTIDGALRAIVGNMDSQPVAQVVLERYTPHWVLNVDYAPRRAAHRRHLELTHDVYAPRDTPEVRALLLALHHYLQSDSRLSGARWFKKEAWLLGHYNATYATPWDKQTDTTTDIT
ncbi:MAG: hypothetical protein PHE53_00450 [Thermoguttaceae bacterium]|nr:hypothetical protein [Thermoguttaceae bacterium]